MRRRMTRPRFGAASSVKLFGALSARATNGPARRFKESRESRPPINTRVKETVKISTCPASRAATSREALGFRSSANVFIPRKRIYDG